MNEPLIIGTRGWDHAAWVGEFYPPELPDDWRFCFYSNNLRSVLVPQTLWATATPADLAQWLSDSDPAFRFVLELPATISAPLSPAKLESALESFLNTVDPILPRTAGLLLRMAPDTSVLPEWFEQLIHRLSQVAPLCVDLPENEWRDPAIIAALDRQDVGLAWHGAHELAPHPGGRLLVALTPAASPREVRGWIEQLARWQKPGTLAGLYFDAPVGAAKAAQEARLIAELLGV